MSSGKKDFLKSAPSPSGTRHNYTQAEHQKEVNALVEKFTKTLQHQLANHYAAIIKKRLLEERGVVDTIHMTHPPQAEGSLFPPIRSGAGAEGRTAQSLGVTAVTSTIPSELVNVVSLPPLPTALHSPTPATPTTTPSAPKSAPSSFTTASSPKGSPSYSGPILTNSSTRVGSPTNPLRDAALARFGEERSAKQAILTAAQRAKQEEEENKWAEYLVAEEQSFKKLLEENPAAILMGAEELGDLLERRMRSALNPTNTQHASSEGLSTSAAPKFGSRRTKEWTVADTAQEVRLYKQKLRHDRIREMKTAITLQKKKDKIPLWRQTAMEEDQNKHKGIDIISDESDRELSDGDGGGGIPNNNIGHNNHQSNGKTFWSPRQDLRQAVLRRAGGQHQRRPTISGGFPSQPSPPKQAQFRFGMMGSDDPLQPPPTRDISHTHMYASGDMMNQSGDIIEAIHGDTVPAFMHTPHPPYGGGGDGSPTSLFHRPQQQQHVDNTSTSRVSEDSKSPIYFTSDYANQSGSEGDTRPSGPTLDQVVNQLLSKMTGPYRLGSRETVDSVERDVDHIKFTHSTTLRELKQKLRGATSDVRTIFSTLGNVIEGSSVGGGGGRGSDTNNKVGGGGGMVSPSLSLKSGSMDEDSSMASASQSFGGGLASLTDRVHSTIIPPAAANNNRVPILTNERKQTRERLLENCQDLDVHINRVTEENKLLLAFVQQGYEGLQKQVQQLTHLSNKDLNEYMKKFEEVQRRKSMEAEIDSDINNINRRSTAVVGRGGRGSVAASLTRKMSYTDVIPDILGLKSGVAFLSTLSKEAKYMGDATTFFDNRKRDLDDRKEAQFADPAAEVIATAISKMQSHGTDLIKTLKTNVPPSNTLQPAGVGPESRNPSLFAKSTISQRGQYSTSIHSNSGLLIPVTESPKLNKSEGARFSSSVVSAAPSSKAVEFGNDPRVASISITVGSVGFSLNEPKPSYPTDEATVESEVVAGGDGATNPLDSAVADVMSAAVSRKHSTTSTSLSSSAHTTGGAVSVFSSTRWAPRTLNRNESFMSTTSASPSMAASMSPSRRYGGGGARRVAPGHKKKKKGKTEDPKQTYTFSRKQIDIVNINQLLETVKLEKEKLEEELAAERLAHEEQERKRREAARSNDIALQIALVLETHEKKSELLTDVDIKRVEGMIQNSDVMISRLTAIRDRIAATIEEKEILKKDLSANVTSDINELDELLTRTDAETRYARIQRKNIVAKYWEWRKLREVGDESAAPTFFEQLKRGPSSQETAVQNCIQVETMPAQLRRFARLVRKEEAISRVIRTVEVTIGDLELCNREVHELLCCPCCQRTFEDPVSLWPCGHTFCRECSESEQIQLSRGVHRCPKCSTVGTEGSLPNPIVEEVIAKWEVMERGYLRMRQALKHVKVCITKIQQRTLQRRMSAVSGTVVVDQLVAAGVTVDEGWGKYTGASIPASVLELIEKKAKAAEREDDVYDLDSAHNQAHKDFLKSMNSFHFDDNNNGSSTHSSSSSHHHITTTTMDDTEGSPRSLDVYKTLVMTNTSSQTKISPKLPNKSASMMMPPALHISDGEFSESSGKSSDDD